MSSQLLPPTKAPGPKFTSVEKNPLVKVMLLLVTGPASGVPPELVAYRVNCRAYVPLAGMVGVLRRPW